MLQINKRAASPDEVGAAEPDSPADMLASYVRIVRRQFPVILTIIACVTALGLVYLFTATPKFTATATMVIDTRKVQLFQQQSALGDIAIDPATVETQVEIIKSENVSLSVIKDLHLIDDPELVGPGGGLIGTIFQLLSSLTSADETKSQFELTRRALTAFENMRSVRRVGLSYVMEIGFTSLDPEKAARIANATVDAYIVDQLDAKYQATKRASIWLQDRIKELRTQASAASRAVVDFKQKNNIIDTGGRLMTEQQLGEVNSQLILAHAATAEAKARLDRIQDIMKNDIPDASVTDALKNDVIVRLRQQYLDLSAREADWSRKYGQSHIAVVNLRNQMLELRRSIKNELQRIAESDKSDLDIAKTREDSVKSSLASVVSETQLTNQAQVQLRELESNAQTYQAMYDNFLQRYMEAVQQQSFPITEARLIGPASRPLTKSRPKTLIVLAVTLMGGLMLSFGVAMGRELSDNVFRTSGQIEELLQTNCLAILPSIKRPQTAPSPVNSKQRTLEPSGSRVIARNPNELLRYAVDAPFSRYTEAIRSIKVAADLNGAIKSNKVIAITSTLPNEGKSTVAANFAQLIAHTGARAILVDADLRNPSLSRAVPPHNEVGLIDVITKGTTLKNAVWTDPVTKLTFLAAGASSKLLHTSEILASTAMRDLVDGLKSSFDYVIIDLPPLAPIVDVRATTGFVNSYVFVIEWGRTKFDIVRHNLARAPEVYDRLLGVVLNKADTALLARYDYHQGKYHYAKYYARYGYVE